MKEKIWPRQDTPTVRLRGDLPAALWHEARCAWCQRWPRCRQKPARGPAGDSEAGGTDKGTDTVSLSLQSRGRPPLSQQIQTTIKFGVEWTWLGGCQVWKLRLIGQTCVFVSPEEQRRRVGVDQKLHVVQCKLLNVIPQLVLLIHSLQKTQSSGAHLKAKQWLMSAQTFTEAERLSLLTTFLKIYPEHFEMSHQQTDKHTDRSKYIISFTKQ